MLRKITPHPTSRWDPHRFTNLQMDDTIEDEEEGEDVYYYYEEDEEDDLSGYDFDQARLRRRIAPMSEAGVIHDAMPVMDAVLSPVEMQTDQLPMPTLSSPVATVGMERGWVDAGAGAGVGAGRGEDMGMDPQSVDATCCGPYIGHFELRQTREDLGMNAAQRARYGRGPGEGVSLQSTEGHISGTQGIHGPVGISEPVYTEELYDQGFVSMGAVPSVFVGVFTDPYTGEEFDGYESGMPPPDADYEESVSAPGRNVKLSHLQGGWSDTTPRPTKVEVLDDDFHMQYDRSIGTFGTYDPTYYRSVIEANNRFNRDDTHPEGGPLTQGTPANTLGNQGNVKIRFTPHVPPTHRGVWAETTFRTGIDASTEGAGGGSQRPEYEYTTVPLVRAETNRFDGGGAEAGGAYGGFMNQATGFDVAPTQRSATEHRAPNMGPAGDGCVHALGVYGDVAAPTGNSGTQDVGVYAVGPVTGEHDGAMLQNALVSTPHSVAGLEAVEELAFGGTQYAYGEGGALMNQKVENVTSKTGAAVNQHTTWGATGKTGGHHAHHLDGGVRTAMDKTKRQQLLRVQTAFDTALGNLNAPPTHTEHSRFSDKSGHLVDFLMPGSTLGGNESLDANGSHVRGQSTHLDTKRQAVYHNQFGVNVSASGVPDGTLVVGSHRVGGRGPEHLSEQPRACVAEGVASTEGGGALGFRELRELVGR